MCMCKKILHLIKRPLLKGGLSAEGERLLNFWLLRRGVYWRGHLKEGGVYSKHYGIYTKKIMKTRLFSCRGEVFIWKILPWLCRIPFSIVPLIIMSWFWYKQPLRRWKSLGTIQIWRQWKLSNFQKLLPHVHLHSKLFHLSPTHQLLYPPLF